MCALAAALPAAIAPQDSSTAQSGGAAIAAWADTLPFEEGAIGGIEQFAKEKSGEFEPGYAPGLAAGIRRLICADVKGRLDALSAGERRSFIEATVLDPGFASPGEIPADDSLEQEFEKSFVRTEVLAFFDNEDAPPREALDLYTDPEFRKAVSSRIERIWSEGDEVCVEMSGVTLLLDPLKYCDRIEELHGGDLAVQHTQAVRSEAGDGYQTVYFKESLKTFVRFPDGLAFHYINYSRTVGMGGMKKKIGLGKIENSEEKAVEELRQRLLARREGAGE
jgi:hypothetical protein